MKFLCKNFLIYHKIFKGRLEGDWVARKNSEEAEGRGSEASEDKVSEEKEDTRKDRKAESIEIPVGKFVSIFKAYFWVIVSVVLLAVLIFVWFNGWNRLGVSMLSPEGGVYDGLASDGFNENQGAESLISYLLAFSSVREISVQKLFNLSQDF